MDSYPFEDGAARGWQFAKRFFDVESPLLFRREESEGPNIGARVIFELTSNYSIYNDPIAAGKAAAQTIWDSNAHIVFFREFYYRSQSFFKGGVICEAAFPAVVILTEDIGDNGCSALGFDEQHLAQHT